MDFQRVKAIIDFNSQKFKKFYNIGTVLRFFTLIPHTTTSLKPP